MTAIKQLLKRQGAAYALNLSIRQTDKEIANGNLESVKIGRSVRIRPEAIDNYVKVREGRVNRTKKGTAR